MSQVAQWRGPYSKELMPLANSQRSSEIPNSHMNGLEVETSKLSLEMTAVLAKTLIAALWET